MKIMSQCTLFRRLQHNTAPIKTSYDLKKREKAKSSQKDEDFSTKTFKSPNPRFLPRGFLQHRAYHKAYKA